jgi:ubiquinone biosynthesis protein UbiJ
MSALDNRIRLLAREEAHSLFITPEQAEEWKAREARFAAEQPPNRVAELEKQVAELAARVAELEKTAAPAPAKRTARKTSAEATE